MRPALPAAALFAALLSAAAPARATPPPAAAKEPAPAHMFGPVIARETEVRIESERLSFVYAESARDLVTFEARYVLVNPSSAREELAIAFYRWHTDEFRITVDGAAPVGTPTEGELEALERSLSSPSTSLLGALLRWFVQLGAAGEHPERIAFRLAAEPGTRHEIVVSGRARGHREREDSKFLEIEAVVARHLLLGSRRPDIDHYVFADELSPIGPWKAFPRADVSIAYPSRWRTPKTGVAGDWTTRRDGAKTVLTRSLEREELRALRVEIDAGHSRVRNGGPLLGIGGTFGPNHGVRGRIGYEIASPEWLLYSLTVDTDFRRRAIVTPMIEAASAAVLILPSFGLGVGVPVQIVPQARPGVRFQGDIHLYPIGFVTSIDVFPKLGSLPTLGEVSLLAQVSF